jgi:hypothetical protein
VVSTQVFHTLTIRVLHEHLDALLLTTVSHVNERPQLLHILWNSTILGDEIDGVIPTSSVRGEM